jgi:hypothetical protein
MHPYFQKRFWKNKLRKKRKTWSVSVHEFRRKFSSRKIYKFFLWKLTRKDDNSRRKRFRLWPKISARRFRFALKSPKKPWWIIVGGLSLITLVAGLPTYFVGYPLLREYKFHRFNKTAKAALKNGDTYTALLTAQTAHLLQPGDLSAIQTLVTAAEISEHPKLFYWQRILANHPDANFTNRSVFLNSALQRGNLTDAKDWYNKLSPSIEEKEQIFFQCLILAKQGDEAQFEAYQLADNFLQKNPYTSPICEFFWDFCLQSNQNYLFEEALNDLKTACKLSSPISYEALRRLLSLETGTSEERKDWAKKLWQINSPSLHDAVICLNASYGEKRINGVSLLSALKQDFPDLDHADETHRLIQLLNSVGRPQTASQLLPNDLNSSQHKGTYLRTISSALSFEDTPLAESLIHSVAPSLSHNERRFFDLLIHHREAGKNHPDEAELAKMFSNCSNAELQTLSMFLRFFKSPNYLLGFLEEMEKRNPQREGIKYLLSTSYHRLGMHEELRYIVSRTRLPESIQNLAGERQTCIQKTLYGIELPACTAWAELAFSEYPNNQSVRFTLALCYLMNDENYSAGSLLSRDFQKAPPLCPTLRLIGALALHRNKSFELSKKWAPQEHFSLLTDAERTFLKEVITQSQ